jgi:hypothetical protein
MNRRAKVAAALAVGLCAAGCGAGDTTPASRTVPRTSGSTARARKTPPSGRIGQDVATITQGAPSSLTQNTLAPVGAMQRVATEGAGLSVILRAVIDPLTGSGANLQAGTRAVAVVVQIRNAGPAVYDSSATGDFTVVPSSGTVTPVLATRGPCKTPVEDFDRYITAGEDRVGCVVFAIPDGATLTAVRFSPHARAAGSLVWAA